MSILDHFPIYSYSLTRMFFGEAPQRVLMFLYSFQTKYSLFSLIVFHGFGAPAPPEGFWCDLSKASTWVGIWLALCSAAAPADRFNE